MITIQRLESLSRERPLTDQESDELARCIQREPHRLVYRRWTLQDNQALLQAARKRGGLKEYAEMNDRTYASAQNQLRKLKQARQKRGVAFVGRFFYDGEIGGE